ncbi:MAG: hypothetical protein JNK59_00995 [Sterolibacteriaceae bacterium]|nr:hypothetical protein [Sterolibacteriaceae bacterium]
MLTAALIKSLQVFGIAIVISAIVAMLIKALVWCTARLEKAKPVEVPLGEVCPIGPGVPEDDVAALSAAIFAMVGPHHVLHIAKTGNRWASGARAAQHSHSPGPR